MAIESSGASRAGGDGTHNEDAFLVSPELGLFVVCDGASQAPAGEVAARIATQAVGEAVSQARANGETGSLSAGVVDLAMRRAVESLREATQASPELAGLATTVTMLLAHDRRGVIGHRGDSRAYLQRGTRVRQLTVDSDSTRALDADPDDPQAFDVFTVDLSEGDVVVLCSDGAQDVVEDATLWRNAGRLPPRILASRIVSAANRQAPHDDATAVVLRVGGLGRPDWLEASRSPRATTFGYALHSGGADEERRDRAGRVRQPQEESRDTRRPKVE